MYFTVSPNIASIITQDTSRINILKSLAGINWRQPKETNLITQKILIRSFLSMAFTFGSGSQRLFINPEASNYPKLSTISNEYC